MLNHILYTYLTEHMSANKADISECSFFAHRDFGNSFWFSDRTIGLSKFYSVIYFLCEYNYVLEIRM